MLAVGICHLVLCRNERNEITLPMTSPAKANASKFIFETGIPL
jgi:hypothetical protein